MFNVVKSYQLYIADTTLHFIIYYIIGVVYNLIVACWCTKRSWKINMDYTYNKPNRVVDGSKMALIDTRLVYYVPWKSDAPTRPI